MPEGDSEARTPGLLCFPGYRLLVVEERLREQEAEGVDMPGGMERDELALRIFDRCGVATLTLRSAGA
jgi:hypothetical protein